MKIILLGLILFISACATTGEIKKLQDRIDQAEATALIRDKQLAIAMEQMFRSFGDHLMYFHNPKKESKPQKFNLRGEP